MKTKIIATVGPASSSEQMLTSLAHAGVSIFRLNFSHGDKAFFTEVIGHIRNIEKKLGRPCTVMQDLSGPKIRIGILPKDMYNVQKGDRFLLGLDGESNNQNLPFIPFEYEVLLKTLVLNDRLVLADGGLEFSVAEVLNEHQVIIESEGFGVITSRKGLALPNKNIPLPALTEKDKRDLKLGLELGVDAVAMSFVQTAEDVRELKNLIAKAGKSLPVVAKLERQQAIDNLEAIVAEADMIMVARGDLGVECPLSTLPATQKKIIAVCNHEAKPVVVATQMLLSMVHSLSPTRAEVTDVANAVLDGADCVMLSEETAMGDYPVETVGYMRKIVQDAESYLVENRKLRFPQDDCSSAQFLAYAACLLAEKHDTCCLAAHSQSGIAARLLSACRPKQEIYALTPNKEVYGALNFSWGIRPVFVEDNTEPSHLVRVQNFLAKNDDIPVGADVVITAGDQAQGEKSRSTNLVKVFTK